MPSRWLIALLLIAPCMQAEPFNPQHSRGYQQSTWSSIHGDASNSDHVPLTLSTQLRQNWHILQGAASWTAPSVAADGTLYITTGRGAGFSHLHAINREGELLWQSKPYRQPDDLGPLAVVSAPLLGDDGTIYVGDSNQLFAFLPNGERQWVVDLEALGVEGPFLTAIITGDTGQYVGGVSASGQVALFERTTGELARPVLKLPGGSNVVGNKIPRGLWRNGLLDADARQQVWDLLRGQRYPVSNTPAVHPRTGRIYITAAGDSEDQGLLFGIDVDDAQLRIVFATVVPPESGTSPAISPDGRRVYAMGGGGLLYAIAADSGRLLWSVDTRGQDASPTIGPDNTVYVLGGDKLVAVDGFSGELKWQNHYLSWAQEKKPRLWKRLGMVKNGGKPKAYVDSVVTVTNDMLWTTLLVGYPVNLFGKEFTHPAATYLVALDPGNGAVISDWPLPDSSEGTISVSPVGDLYLNLLAVQTSIARHSGYQWLLPKAVRVPQPQAGVVAFTPSSWRGQIEAGLSWLQSAGDMSLDQYWLDNIGSQVWSLRKVLTMARYTGELSVEQIEQLSASLDDLAASVDSCQRQHADCQQVTAKLGALTVGFD